MIVSPTSLKLFHVLLYNMTWCLSLCLGGGLHALPLWGGTMDRRGRKRQSSCGIHINRYHKGCSTTILRRTDVHHPLSGPILAMDAWRAMGRNEKPSSRQESYSCWYVHTQDDTTNRHLASTLCVSILSPRQTIHRHALWRPETGVCRVR